MTFDILKRMPYKVQSVKGIEKLNFRDKKKNPQLLLQLVTWQTMNDSAQMVGSHLHVPFTIPHVASCNKRCEIFCILSITQGIEVLP